MFTSCAPLSEIKAIEQLPNIVKNKSQFASEKELKERHAAGVSTCCALYFVLYNFDA